MKKVPVAVAVIVNSKGEILLTKRNDPKNLNVHLKWQLPGGGIEKKETPHQACIREILEETGYEIELITQNSRVIRHSYIHKEYILHGFKAKVVSGTINVENDDETLDAKWFDIGEIGELSKLDDTLEMIELVI